MPARKPAGNPQPTPDKRQAARAANKPQAARQPSTNLNRAKDDLKVDRARGRGPAGTKAGSPPAPKGAARKKARG